MIGIKLRILLYAAALATAAFGGGWVEHQRGEARVQSLIAAQAQRDAQAADLVAAAERANTARLQAAQAAADTAIAAAQARAEANAKQSQELRHALNTATSRTRQCLSAAAVRLLNAPAAPGAGSPGLRLPTHPASTAAASSASPADTGRPASEQAVADWIVTARQMYEVCRGRVDAVREWSARTAQ